MSVMVIALSFGLLGIIVGVAYWFAREEQKTTKRIPPEEEMDEDERQTRRTDMWEAAGYLGMTVEILSQRYGHPHPDHLAGAKRAFARHRKIRQAVAG